MTKCTICFLEKGSNRLCISCGCEQTYFEPTEEDISKECTKIQMSWTDYIRKRRRFKYVPRYF